MNTSEKEQVKNGQLVAKTIIQQIKATDFWALGSWGAKNYVFYREGEQGKYGYILGGIQFDVNGAKCKRGTKVIIFLMGDDTYKVRIVRVYNSELTEIKTVDNVYCDELMSTIDEIIER